LQACFKINFAVGLFPPTWQTQIMNLSQAPLQTTWRIQHIQATQDQQERARQLQEIGFLPGELVCVLTHGFPGGDPLVVRVGLSTFALRKAEAQCIELEPKAIDA
jgi:ferrous iron transport protein A